MNIKQLKESISKFPDDTEIYIINSDLDINKPNDDLFLLESSSLNGISLLTEHYEDECSNIFDLKDKNGKYTAFLSAIDPTTGEKYSDTTHIIGRWRMENLLSKKCLT